MESNAEAKAGKDSNVSCFALDGVVAEMVIDIDVDDFPQKSLKLAEPKLKGVTSQPSKSSSENLCNDLSSEPMNISDDEDDSIDPKEKGPSTSIETSIDRLKSSESLDTEESKSLGSSVGLEKPLTEDEVKKSIFLELNHIRETGRLTDEIETELLVKNSKEDCDLSESEILNPILKSADEKKELKLKSMSNSELSVEKESMENVMPTSISTRGNKRKLAEIETDTTVSNKKKCTDLGKASKKKENLEKCNKTSSEKISMKPLANATPKLYNLFAKDARLKNFLHLKKAMKEVDLKFTRQLYRILFDKWAPTDIAKMKDEILEFSGFPFDRNSEEVLKRRHILKKLPDLSLKKICYMLDLSKAKQRDNRISSILKFLHKPRKTVYCTIDPFQSCMQPLVMLEKLSFEYRFLLEAEKKRSNSQQIRRVGRPPKKLLGYKHLLEAAKKHSNNKNHPVRKVGRPPQKHLVYKHLLDAAKKSSFSISEQFRKTGLPRKGKLTEENRKVGRPPKKKAVGDSKETSSTSQDKALDSMKKSPAVKDTLKNTPRTKSVPSLLKEPVITYTPKNVKVTVTPDKKSPLSKAELSEKKDSSVTPTFGTNEKVSKSTDPKLISASGKKSQAEEKTIKNSANIKAAISKSPPAALKAPKKKKSAILKSSQKKSMKHKIKKLKKEISELKVKVDETFMHAKNNAENGSILPSFGKEKEIRDNQSDSSSFTHQDVRNEDDSSEVTLSADESTEGPKKEEFTKKKKKKMVRCGKPLRSFTNIRDSIQNGNFSALQRLHILLFGASDKPENLKANILAFGGFPFLEGSDEWKQKEFLLSLLSLSTLKEYSTLLCIDHIGDDQQAVLSKLMKFLAAPGGSSIEIEVDSLEGCIDIIEDEPVPNMKTKVVHSELVQPIKIVDTKSIAPAAPKAPVAPKALVAPKAPVAPKKKPVKKKEKTKGKGSAPRHRKVLMSEAEVRRLEADIKREQRIRDREKRMQDQSALQHTKSLVEQKLIHQAIATSGQQKNIILTQVSTPTLQNTFLLPLGNTSALQKNIILPQANSLNLHRTPLGTSVFLPISSINSGTIQNTSNYQAAASTVMTLTSTAASTVRTTTKTAASIASTPTRTPHNKNYKGNCKIQPVPPFAKQADADQLNALLQTVYKRRALKASGATISIPNKGESSKLGDLPNVKFLVVTANYSDLDVLHHLIYMTDAAKPKVRKNILDFSGFGFSEDSELYKDRMDFLNSLGYDISKRIAFLLGLCPYKADIDKQDLNELIMYFLMSPCKTKQVPITHLPQTFFSKNMPEELCMLMNKHSELEISPVPDSSNNENTVGESLFELPELSSSESSPVVASTSTSIIKPQNSGPKAKKSLPSSSKKLSSFSHSVANTPFKDALILPKSTSPQLIPNIDTSNYALQKAILKTSSLSEPVTSPQEFLVQQTTPDGRQKTYKLIKLPVNHPLSSVIKPQLPNSTTSSQITLPSSITPTTIPASSSFIQPSLLQTPTSIIQPSLLQTPTSIQPSLLQTPTSIQPSLLQTPTSIQPSLLQTPTSSIQTTPTSLSTPSVPPGMLMPPGIIIYKDKNKPPLAITSASLPSNSLQTLPIVFGQQNPIILPQNVLTVPAQASTNSNLKSSSKQEDSAKTEVTLPLNVSTPAEASSLSSEEEDSTTAIESTSAASESRIQGNKRNSKSVNASSGVVSQSPIQVRKTGSKNVSGVAPKSSSLGDKPAIFEIFEVTKTVKSNKPPTDGELYSSIQKIIENSDPEQITLRNVIDKVSAQYPDFSLKPRCTFMKECVKKILLETS